MNILKRYQNIIVSVVVIGAAFIGYSIFFTGGNSDALIAQDIDPAQSAVEQELIALLLQLRSITLDTSVFSTQEFRSLQDFSQDLVPEPVGRPNPFAPL